MRIDAWHALKRHMQLQLWAHRAAQTENKPPKIGRNTYETDPKGTDMAHSDPQGGSNATQGGSNATGGPSQGRGNPVQGGSNGVDSPMNQSTEVAGLIEALGKIMPVRVNDGPDYAEVYFADGSAHSTQAMTMNPQDWLDLQKAYDALAALTASIPPTTAPEGDVIMRASKCGHHFNADCQSCQAALDCTNREMDWLRDHRLAFSHPSCEVEPGK